MTEAILEFQGEYRFLSNFWQCHFVWDDIVWNSAESAYQASKTLDRQKRFEFSMMHASEAKKRGKNIILRPNWFKIKIGIMREIVFEKFSQNSDLTDMLISTAPARLEEGNLWGDDFWGITPPGSGHGRNELGKILMDVRDHLSKSCLDGLIVLR